MYGPSALSELGEDIEALRRDPESDDHADVVRRKAREGGALGPYADAFAERGILLGQRGLAAEAISSFVEAALIYEEELEQLDSAAELYRKVLELDQDHRRALFALGLLLHDLGRWDDLIALYRRRIEQCRDDGERTTLHLYVAELLSERFLDDNAAFNEVTTAARLAPRNIRIISRLETLGERTGRIDEVAVVIGDLILNQEDPRVRAALSLRLAELHLGPLDDPKRALACLRAALQDDGGNPEILSEVEDVFRERARFDELAEILEEAAKDRRIGPHRVRLERELARIYELELNDPRRALLAMTRALKNAPGDRELMDEVLRLGLSTSEMAIVAETYEEVADSTDNALLRTYVRLKLGHIYAGTLGRLDDAVRVYWAILEDDPSHKEAVRRLKAIQERRGDHRDIARMAAFEAQGPEGERAVEPLRRLARIRRDALDDVPGAVEAWRRILDVAPHDPEALSALASIEGSGPGAPPPNRDLDLAERVGTSIVETRADEMPTEFEGTDFGPETDTAFDSDGPPSAPAPSILQSVRIVEGTKVKGPPPPPPRDPADDPVPRDFAEATPSAAGAWIEAPPLAPSMALISDLEVEPSPTKKIEEELEERVVALQQELQEATRAGDQPRAIEILREVIRANERLGHEERAFFAVMRLVEIEPTMERLEDSIRLGRRAQGQAKLIDTVQTIARGLPLEGRVKLGLQLAEVELEDLGDQRAAFARLEALAAEAPDDPLVFERWTTSLERAGRFGELVKVLSQRSLAIAGSPEALPLARRAVQLAEVELADPIGAARVLIAFLDRAPEKDDLRQEAATLLAKAEAWPELVAFLESGLHRVEGPDRTDVRVRIARLHLDRLGDVDSAEKTLRIGLEERARDPDLLAILEEIYETQQEWKDLVEVLLRRLEVVKGARARCVVRRKIAQVSEQHLGNVDLALEMLSLAIHEDPADLDALRELERLRRSREDWDGVIEVLSLRAKAERDPENRAATLVTIATIYADARGDFEAAAASLRDALAMAPEHKEVLEALAGIEERRGDYLVAIDALRALAGQVEGADRARVYVRIGEIFERRLDDVEAATIEYQDAYDADPKCLESILALFRLRELEEDFARAHDLAAKAAELTIDDRDKAALFRRAAQIALDRVGDEVRALDYYERALKTDPEDLATSATVGELLLARQEVERAYPHLVRAAAGLSDPARTASLYRAAGQASEKLKKRDDAIACYEAALLRAPRAFEPLRRLSALLEQPPAGSPAQSAGGSTASSPTPDWPRVYELSASLLLHHEGQFAPIERSVIYLRMARAKRAAKDFSAATRLARKANQLSDSLIEPLILLAEVLAENQEPFEAAECLKRLSQMLKAPHEKRDALYRAATLLADRAGDVSRAAAMLAEAQSFVPGDVQVAELLATHRERLGDPEGAASALVTTARVLSGRIHADLLVRAARILAGPGRDRARAKRLLFDALQIVTTHQEALAELCVMLEFDGEEHSVVEIYENAASWMLEYPAAAEEAEAIDPKAEAMRLLEEVVRLSRFRLDDPKRALVALRTLIELSPGAKRYHEDLARLLDRAVAGVDSGGSLVDEAIGAWARLVEERIGDLEGLRRLSALGRQGKDSTVARVADELLVAMGDPASKDRRPNGESQDARPPKTRVEVPHHPGEDSALAELFERLGYAPIRAFYDALPEPKPKKRDLVGAAGLGIHVTRPLEEASAILGMSPPPVYVRDDAKEAVAPALVLDQPALVVSLVRSAKHSPAELRFLLGRALSLLRPRALALASVPLDILRDGLAGVARPSLDFEAVFADPKQAKKRGKSLEKALAAEDRAIVAELAGRWLGEPDRAATLGLEREAVHRSAERVGLVASGSLLVSIDTLKSLSDGHIERAWHIPLLEFASTRRYADIVRRSAV